MSKPPRSYRVAEKVREALAIEILRCSDPRLNLVSLTGVKLSADLREASVYWTVHGDEKRVDEVQEGLLAACGHFKSILAKKLETRFVPNLRFYYDNTLDMEQEVDQLMKRVAEKEGFNE